MTHSRFHLWLWQCSLAERRLMNLAEEPNKLPPGESAPTPRATPEKPSAQSVEKKQTDIERWMASMLSKVGAFFEKMSELFSENKEKLTPNQRQSFESGIDATQSHLAAPPLYRRTPAKMQDYKKRENDPDVLERQIKDARFELADLQLKARKATHEERRKIAEDIREKVGEIKDLKKDFTDSTGYRTPEERRDASKKYMQDNLDIPEGVLAHAGTVASGPTKAMDSIDSQALAEDVATKLGMDPEIAASEIQKIIATLPAEHAASAMDYAVASIITRSAYLLKVQPSPAEKTRATAMMKKYSATVSDETTAFDMASAHTRALHARVADALSNVLRLHNDGRLDSAHWRTVRDAGGPAEEVWQKYLHDREKEADRIESTNPAGAQLLRDEIAAHKRRGVLNMQERMMIVNNGRETSGRRMARVDLNILRQELKTARIDVVANTDGTLRSGGHTIRMLPQASGGTAYELTDASGSTSHMTKAGLISALRNPTTKPKKDSVLTPVVGVEEGGGTAEKRNKPNLHFKEQKFQELVRERIKKFQSELSGLEGEPKKNKQKEAQDWIQRQYTNINNEQQMTAEEKEKYRSLLANEASVLVDGRYIKKEALEVQNDVLRTLHLRQPGNRMNGEWAVVVIPPKELDPYAKDHAYSGNAYEPDRRILYYPYSGHWGSEGMALSKEAGIRFHTEMMPTTYGSTKPRGVVVEFTKPGRYFVNGRALDVAGPGFTAPEKIDTTKQALATQDVSFGTSPPRSLSFTIGGKKISIGVGTMLPGEKMEGENGIIIERAKDGTYNYTIHFYQSGAYDMSGVWDRGGGTAFHRSVTVPEGPRVPPLTTPPPASTN